VATSAFAQQPPLATEQQIVGQYGLMPAHTKIVKNMAQLSCRLVTVAPAGKWGRSSQIVGITDLAPGEMAIAGEKKRRKGGFFNPFSMPPLVGYDRSSNLEIPITALYFTSVNGVACYVGAGRGLLRVPGGGNGSDSLLTFNDGDIRFADDIKTTIPMAKPSMAQKAVIIPYFGTDGTAIQLFVWNSSVPAYITTTNGDKAELQLGTVKAFVGRSPITITISATGLDGTVKTWSQGFQNSDFFGTHAQVFILGMSDLH
jgi:hypothetical protein